jgi:hypothetical protein
MTRAVPLEEPCAGQLACTVLQTSGGSDPFAEFNRALRHPVQWRKTSYGTQSERGSRFVESMLTVLATCQRHQQNTFTYLTACCRAYFKTAMPPALIPQPG